MEENKMVVSLSETDKLLRSGQKGVSCLEPFNAALIQMGFFGRKVDDLRLFIPEHLCDYWYGSLAQDLNAKAGYEGPEEVIDTKTAKERLQNTELFGVRMQVCNFVDSTTLVNINAVRDFLG